MVIQTELLPLVGYKDRSVKKADCGLQTEGKMQDCRLKTRELYIVLFSVSRANRIEDYSG